MFRFLTLCFFCTCFFLSASAQKTHEDSVKKIARADAKTFRLGKAEMQEFRKSKKKYDEKLFAPRPFSASNPALLNDADYVEAYKLEAFRRTKKRRTAGHYILIGTGVYAVLGIVGVILLIKAADNIKFPSSLI